MNFNVHSDLVGQHAFLGPSKYHWVNYDEDKLSESYKKYLAIQRGITLHDFAKRCIDLGQKLPRGKAALNQYVNDCIGYRMSPEQVLYYSNNAYGTTDAISFRSNLLRIHDLKTGISPVSIHQLEIYAALFCLEYRIKPEEISMELRIYQEDNDILVVTPIAETIRSIMDKIILFDKKLDKLKLEEGDE
jgi:hypothetical protein